MTCPFVTEALSQETKTAILENGLRNIEDINIGDLVWAYDFDNNKPKLIFIYQNFI